MPTPPHTSIVLLALPALNIWQRDMVSRLLASISRRCLVAGTAKLPLRAAHSRTALQQSFAWAVSARPRSRMQPIKAQAL
jgi:hypothetical protein